MWNCWIFFKNIFECKEYSIDRIIFDIILSIREFNGSEGKSYRIQIENPKKIGIPKSELVSKSTLKVWKILYSLKRKVCHNS